MGQFPLPDPSAYCGGEPPALHRFSLPSVFSAWVVAAVAAVLPARAELTFTPDLAGGLMFNPARVGESSSRTLTITVLPDAGDSVTVALSLTGGDADNFACATREIRLPDGGRAEVRLTFNPDAVRTFTTQLVVTETPDSGGAAEYSGAVRGRGTHFRPPARSSSFMNVLVESLTGIDVVDRAELACLTPEGYVGGLAFLDTEHDRWGMALWGYESFPDTINGFRHGDPLRFVYWDPHDWELEVTATPMGGGQLVYRANTILQVGLTVDVPVEPPIPPAEFGIAAVSPNPFNSAVRVAFAVNQPGKAVLTLFDLAGNPRAKVESLVTPGLQFASFHTPALPSGLYLVNLELNGASSVRRAVLLK